MDDDAEDKPDSGEAAEPQVAGPEAMDHWRHHHQLWKFHSIDVLATSVDCQTVALRCMKWHETWK